MIIKVDLIKLYLILNPDNRELGFSNAHGTFTKIGHICPVEDRGDLHLNCRRFIFFSVHVWNFGQDKNHYDVLFKV